VKVTALAIPDVKLVEPKVWGDARGFFYESFREDRYAELGIVGPFVQDNQSFSQRGVLRGLHFQWPQRAQGKLVSVLQGSVWDVAVDVRRGSPTFGRWVGVELSAATPQQLWVPPGFAHGFVVLSETALCAYKCTDYYSPADEQCVRWDDPALGIPWPVQSPMLSAKDAAARPLGEFAQDLLPGYPKLP
jgi:dTDP-4-dehydrorhamnose 3,5-epimerase